MKTRTMAGPAGRLGPRLLGRIVGALLVACASACGPVPLQNVQPSSDALARDLLAALAQDDDARLQALAVSEDEFEHRVWPGLPASRPERNLPWSYVWMDLRQKSEAALARTRREYAGKRFELQAVQFAGTVTEHGSYRIHRETVLVVRDDRANIQQLRVLGSMIETERGWKVFSYVVDR